MFARAAGSFVYPRLPRTVGLAIIEETRTWDLDKLAAPSSTEHPDAAPIATGTRVDPTVITEARDRVRRVAVERGYPKPLRRGRE